MSIKAIETQYAGYRFRSRLEARWAVFFTTLGLDWQYEPEGFETSAGRYLPDFKITGKGCEGLPGQPRIYFEVKGAPLRQDEADRIAAFVGDDPTERYYLFALGDVPDPRKACRHGDTLLSGWAGQFEGPTPYGPGRGWFAGAVNVRISYRGWDIGRAHGVEFHGPIDPKKMQSQFKDCWLPYYCVHSRTPCDALDGPIGKALAAARSARFEHGETPVAPSR